MSKSHTAGLQATDLPDEPTPKPTLAIVVTKSLQFETTPLWNEYRSAAWAIQDTIERVAPEVR